MRFTGNNTLYVPQVSLLTYLLQDIYVDNTGTYNVLTRQIAPYATGNYNSVPIFTLSSGCVIDPMGRFIGTFNTGEPFSVSGWLDYANNARFVSYGANTLAFNTDPTPSNYTISEFAINCPTSGSLNCYLNIQSQRLTESISFSPTLIVNGIESGYLTASVPMYVTNDTQQFFQSWEALLTGGPLVAFVDNRPNSGVSLTYYDNDSSDQNNAFVMAYGFETPYRQVINNFSIGRTGLYSSGIYQLIDISDTGVFSGLFNGYWSGNNFVYQDPIPDTITLAYYLSKSDSQGVGYPVTASVTVLPNSQEPTLPAEYITGFTLTASGQYMNPPLVKVTGYYYVTGIQESLSSLLFSTGCTGNLYVTFSGGGGNGGTGIIQTQPILFNGVYVDGNQWFNVPYSYTTSGVGTGYLSPPKAYINTGMYGPQCYDVPKYYGYNQAWFAPFDTSGTMTVEAGWFTGVALCTTGIVSGGSTGYYVTGIDVYNIGTGYNAAHTPYLSFVRTGVDVLTANASGTLSMKLSGTNPISSWQVAYSVGGGSWIQTGTSANIPMPFNTPYLYVQLAISGSDITAPILPLVVIGMQGTALTTTTNVSYVKAFSTDPYALKKKVTPTQQYSTSQALDYFTAQSDLDTLYSSAGYTNNSWPFDEGDFDF